MDIGDRNIFDVYSAANQKTRETKLVPLDNSTFTEPINSDSHEKIFIGELLQKADLVSKVQVETALEDQQIYGEQKLKLGEFLAWRGYIKQETADFFACWHQLISERQTVASNHKLGDYLKQAALLNETQIEIILLKQKARKIRFGSLAVVQGFIKQNTLEFFLENLFPEKRLNYALQNHLNRAKNYLNFNRSSGAILELREAIKLEPHNYEIHYLLGLAYLQTKQITMAKMHIKKAGNAKNKPLGKEAKQKLKQILNQDNAKKSVKSKSRRKSNTHLKKRKSFWQKFLSFLYFKL